MAVGGVMIIGVEDVLPGTTVFLDGKEVKDVVEVDTLANQVIVYKRYQTGEFVVTPNGDNVRETLYGQITINFPKKN